MANTKLIIKGNGSPSAYEVMSAAGYEYLGCIDKNYPCREFFKKGDSIVRFNHPVWVGKNVSVIAN